MAPKHNAHLPGPQHRPIQPRNLEDSEIVSSRAHKAVQVAACTTAKEKVSVRVCRCCVRAVEARGHFRLGRGKRTNAFMRDDAG